MEKEAREAVTNVVPQPRITSPRKSKSSAARPSLAQATSETGSAANDEHHTPTLDADARLSEVEKQESSVVPEPDPAQEPDQPTAMSDVEEERPIPPSIVKPVVRGETLVRAFFEHDPLVRDYKARSVLCDGCSRWIQLGQAWTLSKWHRHCERPTHARTSYVGHSLSPADHTTNSLAGKNLASWSARCYKK